MDIPRFDVNKPEDWYVVADHLIANATAAPLSQADSEQYSRTPEEAWRRAQAIVAAGRSSEATKYSVAVTYHASVLISMILTVEPGVMHLSMVQIIAPMLMKKLSQHIATEAAKHILGHYEERREGALRSVRHFYLRKG